MALDRALRAFGGAPTYALTDNERTVSVDHVCGIAVRNPTDRGGRPPLRADDRDVRAGRSRRARAARRRRSGSRRPIWCRPITTCAATTRTSRRSSTACVEFCERVNTREHRVTRRAPAVMLAEERARLHPLPAVPHTVCFGADAQGRPGSRRSRSAARIYSVPYDAGRRARVGPRRRRRAGRRARRRAATGRARSRATR